MQGLRPLPVFPTTPRTQRPHACTYTVWAGSRSLAATKEVSSISSPAGTEMVQFPASAPCGLCIHPRVAGNQAGRVSPLGNPRVITIVAICPRLIAGFHVLHRFSVPSHPPYALNILTTTITAPPACPHANDTMIAVNSSHSTGPTIQAALPLKIQLQDMT